MNIHWKILLCLQVNIGAGPDRVKIYGPGVEPGKVKANEPTYFTVDAKDAGNGELKKIKELKEKKN